VEYYDDVHAPMAWALSQKKIRGTTLTCRATMCHVTVTALQGQDRQQHKIRPTRGNAMR